MKFNIKRGIKDGKSFCDVYAEGLICTTSEGLAAISDELTGTFTQLGFGRRGIFTGGNKGANCKTTDVEFNYGHERKHFKFPVVDFSAHDVLTIEQLLKERVKQVRDWVASTDYDEELEFVVE
ncbi:MAG: hypothetical protein EHM34_04915 [Nitrosopumilales archaeon]|nr:MAG: hypothetical protein EHM34_04915 [Nitrosopumilales archaeon]